MELVDTRGVKLAKTNIVITGVLIATKRINIVVQDVFFAAIINASRCPDWD